MKQYLCIMEPKHQYRRTYLTYISVVHAKTKADAIGQLIANIERTYSSSPMKFPEWKKPKAHEFNNYDLFIA